MARTRSFDRDAVLAAAGNAFRQHGYRDASIVELERATGLVSGSIYNAFGDKAGLFRAALEHYVHGFVQQRLAVFAGEDAGLDELEQLYLSVLAPPLSDGFGCLVNNSIIEFGTAPGIASDGITETLALVREAIASVLAREIGPDNAEVETMQLVLLYHGVLTLSRSGTDLVAMRSAVHATFERLRAARAQHNKP
ncbi:MAG TPA: TetR/AcrR family transcriptional regulator [Devosia sp.]|jgi:AcrR family transcriptional regulator|uniref:TetR/AcrR family transcriptional regulator n=1 Tax=Devosia sp. TaxID=1871048 RepID=UPI002DDD1FC4|nr:TetR/AcrR family transcriptional regulator [Devosia sp.]HEV2514524.1 TetR/AcrR family transcriptional regulator [Devosia sp.]